MSRRTHNRDGQGSEGLSAEVPGHPGWVANVNGHIYNLDGSRVKEHRKEAGENRLRVTCKKHGYHYVAKLVALAFLGSEANSSAVVHKNGLTADNRLSNLRLVRNAGVNANCAGKRVLSAYERSLLHLFLRHGMAQTDIAAELGVSTRCVRYHSGSCCCPNAIRTGSVARMAVNQDYI